MEQFLKHKLLNIPVLVWILQLVYVAVMLGILIFLVHATKLRSRPSHVIALVVVSYIIVMIAIDVAWRIAIKKHMPTWF